MTIEQPYYYIQHNDTIKTGVDTVSKAKVISDTLVADTIKKSNIILPKDSSTVAEHIQKTDTTNTADTVKAKQKSITDSVTAKSVQPLKPKSVVKKDSAISSVPVTSAPEKKETRIKEKKAVSKKITVKQDSVLSQTKDTLTAKDSGIFVHETVPLPAPVPRKVSSPLNEYNEWLAVLIILSIVATGILRLTSMKYLQELFRAAFNVQTANKMYTSVNIRNSKPSFALSALFIFNTGIFIFEALAFYGLSIFGQKGFTLLIFVWILLLTFGLIKSFLYRLTGFVFDTIQPSGEYLFTSSLLSKVYAIVLLPLISILPFVNIWMVPNLIKLGVGIFISLYILQLIRGAGIFLQNTFSVFYMFLYFCALEILPLVILYKILFS